MPSGSFTADAVIYGGRWQHHRLRDHFGAESDMYVVLSARIGPWEEGTPIHFVIDDLLARVAAVESTDHHLGSFTANAYILSSGSWIESPAGTHTSFAFMDSVLRRARTGSFTASAWVVKGGTFTANAWIRGSGRFTADAVLI